MAEILGIVTGGFGVASFAIRIVESALKLKEYYMAIKDAPDDVRYLIDEIETLSLIIADIGNNERQSDLPSVASQSSQKCFELCQKASLILEAVVRELDETIAKRKKIGGVKAVLKKGTIDTLRDRLRSAHFMMMLSNQTYYE